MRGGDGLLQEAGREVGAAGAVVLASPPAVAGLALAPPARVADWVALRIITRKEIAAS